MSLTCPRGHKNDCSWMPGGRHVAQRKSRCCWRRSCHLDDMCADNDRWWLLIWSWKLIAPHSCWVEGRRPPATVQDRLGGINHLFWALLKLPGECSNPAEAWHPTNMRVNITRRNNTLQRGRSFFYCLGEFIQQQLMAFHFSFYQAI